MPDMGLIWGSLISIYLVCLCAHLCSHKVPFHQSIEGEISNQLMNVRGTN